MMRQQPANILLEKHLTELGLPWGKEVRFHETRRWRFDYVAGDSGGQVAIEIEGSIWTQGRHTRGKGFQADMNKYNTATMMGWRVLRFSVEDVLRGRAKAFIAEWLNNRSTGLLPGKKGHST